MIICKRLVYPDDNLQEASPDDSDIINDDNKDNTMTTTRTTQ